MASSSRRRSWKRASRIWPRRSAALPDWVFDGREGVHAAEGSFSPEKNAKLPRSTLPVYKRQRFPDPLLGEVFAPGAACRWDDLVMRATGAPLSATHLAAQLER